MPERAERATRRVSRALEGRELKAEIVALFRRSGWPTDEITVMVDSEHRVASGGGWHYFR